MGASFGDCHGTLISSILDTGLCCRVTLVVLLWSLWSHGHVPRDQVGTITFGQSANLGKKKNNHLFRDKSESVDDALSGAISPATIRERIC